MTANRDPKPPEMPVASRTVAVDAPSATEIEAALPDHARHFARSTAESIQGAARVVQATERGTAIGKAADWLGVLEKLVEASDKLRAKDMSQVEDMLVHQAIALQAMFVRLSERGLQSTSTHQFDIYLRYALRAQSQCRTTLEALAEIKNPPVVFARQANVAMGPQQINNGTEASARVREDASRQIELSGDGNELRADFGAPAHAGGTDSAVAPVGAVDRPQDCRRKSALGPQRVERRHARHAPRTPAGAGSAKG